MDDAANGHDRWAALTDRYTNLLLARRRSEAEALVGELIDQGADIRDVYLYVFQASQQRIGEMWQRNEVTVATEHYCTAITQRLISGLYPRIFSVPPDGRRAVVACASMELHELGARMVADFLQLEGWDVAYLSANVPSDTVVAEINESKADLLAVSAALPDRVPIIADLIQQVREEAYDTVPVIVGGRPFNVAPTLWKSVKADAHGKDALEGVNIAGELVPKP